MQPEPKRTPSAPANLSAKSLNSITWSFLVVGALAGAATSGSYAALGPLLVVFVIASLGAGVSLVLFVWKVATGRFKQAFHYGIGFVPLALIILWFWIEFHDMHLGKISG